MRPSIRERGVRALYGFEDGRGRPIDSLGGLASFSKELRDWQRQDLDRTFPGIRLTSQAVNCVTFEDVLATADHVDLLHIDAEGYDLELLRLFDFPRFGPPLVRFEHAHLSRADWDEAVGLLARHGYRVLREQYDTTGYLAKAASKARTVHPSVRPVPEKTSISRDV
jgi:Methyltransferase FkbM domain